MNVLIGAGLDVFNCPPQRGPLKSKARFVAMVAGTRGGKTRTAAKKFVARIFRDVKAGKARKCEGVGKDRRPSLHYWVVSPTSDLLKEPKRYLFETIPSELFEDPHRPLNHENQMWLKGDILIEFRSADRPLSLVSVGLDGMWLDEAARIKPDAWVGNLRGRLSDKGGWALFSSTPLGQNWFYTDICLKGMSGSPEYDPDFAVFHWHTSENLKIPREEIESARRNMPARYFKREYEADFAAFLGNVYDEFDEKIHVLNESQLRFEYGIGMQPIKNLFKRVIAGVDWGFQSPGAIVVIGDTGRERIVLEESYAAHRICFDSRLDREFDKDGHALTWVGEARRLGAKWGVSQFFCDSAEPDKIFDFTRSGIAAIGAFKDISYGTRKIAEQLHVVEGKPMLRILDTCKNLIREKRSYVWDQARGSESFKDQPAPNQSDHALDAERYAMVELVRYATAPGAPVASTGRPRF